MPKLCDSSIVVAHDNSTRLTSPHYDTEARQGMHCKRAAIPVPHDPRDTPLQKADETESRHVMSGMTA